MGWFIFRGSRFLILALAFLFFLTGTLGAYSRCLEGQQLLWEHSENRNWHDQQSDLSTESLDCPEDLTAHAIGYSRVLNKQGIALKRGPIHAAAISSKVPDYPFTYGTSRVRSPLLSPHQLVPVYQLTVVYRI